MSDENTIVRSNWERAGWVLIILVGIVFLFYGIFQKSFWDIISKNFLIILGTAVTIFGISFYIIREPSLAQKRFDIIINFLAITMTVVAALMGAYLGTSGSRDLLQEQKNELKHNVADALIIDISTFHDSYGGLVDDYLVDINNNTCSIEHPNMEFYPKTGIYYSYQSEIASFDQDLSESLFIYYHLLESADNDRQIVIENTLGNDITKGTPASKLSSSPPIPYKFNDLEIQKISEIFPFTNDDHLRNCTLRQYYSMGKDDSPVHAARATYQMKKSIIKAYNMTPSLISMLKNESNSTASEIY